MSDITTNIIATFIILHAKKKRSNVMDRHIYGLSFHKTFRAQLQCFLVIAFKQKTEENVGTIVISLLYFTL